MGLPVVVGGLPTGRAIGLEVDRRRRSDRDRSVGGWQPGVAGVHTRYARSGSVSIAYQVVGDGPSDLVLVPGFVSHVEVAWEQPRLARFLGRLAAFSRLIMFDKRGTGMSDPGRGPANR